MGRQSQQIHIYVSKVEHILISASVNGEHHTILTDFIVKDGSGSGEVQKIRIGYGESLESPSQEKIITEISDALESIFKNVRNSLAETVLEIFGIKKKVFADKIKLVFSTENSISTDIYFEKGNRELCYVSLPENALEITADDRKLFYEAIKELRKKIFKK